MADQEPLVEVKVKGGEKTEMDNIRKNLGQEEAGLTEDNMKEFEKNFFLVAVADTKERKT